VVRVAESLGVGLLVAVGAWLLLARGGRRLREVLVPSGAVPGAVAEPVLGAVPGAEPVSSTRTAPWGRRRPAVRSPGGDVRVVVLQVVALLRAGSPPGAAWSRALGVGVDLTGVPAV
jgi:hypothetical protein